MCTVWHINGHNDKTKNENVGNNSSTIIYFLVKINQNFIKFKFFELFYVTISTQSSLFKSTSGSKFQPIILKMKMAFMQEI